MTRSATAAELKYLGQRATLAFRAVQAAKGARLGATRHQAPGEGMEGRCGEAGGRPSIAESRRMTALRAPLPDDLPESKNRMTTINLTEAQMETYRHVRAMLGDRASAPLPSPPRGIPKSAWDGRLQTLLEKGVLSSVLEATPGIAGVRRSYSISRQPHELNVETITEILSRRARAAAAARPPAVEGGEEACGTPVATACDELLARLRKKWPKGAPGELKLKPASPWRPAFHGVEARAL